MPDDLNPMSPAERAFRRLLIDLYVAEPLRAVALQAYADLGRSGSVAAIAEVVQRARRGLLNAVSVYELDPRDAEVVGQVIGDQAQRRHAEVFPR